MTDHEILIELIKDKRRNDRNRYIKNTVRIVTAIAVIVLLIIIVPPIVRFFQQLNETVQQVQDSIAQVNEISENIRTEFEDNLSQIKDLADDVKEQASQKLDELDEVYNDLKESAEQLGTARIGLSADSRLCF